MAVHRIGMDAIRGAFFECWRAAAEHLARMEQTPRMAWLRAHPHPPVLEHLSFRLGNQLFFVRVEGVAGEGVRDGDADGGPDGAVQGPGSLEGLWRRAFDGGGHACVMPMRRGADGRGWIPMAPGWGLLDARARQPVHPPSLVTEERIEMTRWELQDFAVQVVRERLESEGYEVLSWQSDPRMRPSLWFVGDSGEREWVVVEATREDSLRAEFPGNWDALCRTVATAGRIGHFASVGVRRADPQPAGERRWPAPLWRGHAMLARFTGLESATQAPPA